MTAISFKTTEELADYQIQRELQEALRVQAMSDAQRWEWLSDVWGRLQNSGNLFGAELAPSPATSRCYASMDEKNQFDQARELELALQLHINHAR